MRDMSGPVAGPGGARHIIAHQGEYIINQAAIKKYGLRVLDAINRGKMPHLHHKAAAKHLSGGTPNAKARVVLSPNPGTVPFKDTFRRVPVRTRSGG